MLRTNTECDISYARTSNCRWICTLTCYMPVQQKLFCDIYHTNTRTHTYSTHTQCIHTHTYNTHADSAHTHTTYNQICKPHPSDLLQVTTATSWTTWYRMPLPLLSPPTRCMTVTTTTTCRGLTASPVCRWRATGRTTPTVLGLSTSCDPSANSWRQDSAGVGLSWLTRCMIWQN